MHGGRRLLAEVLYRDEDHLVVLACGLTRLLADDDEQVREAAHATLKGISGLDHGLDPNLWQAALLPDG